MWRSVWCVVFVTAARLYLDMEMVVTDAYLLVANCKHGKVWYDCDNCEREEQEELERLIGVKMVHIFDQTDN